MPHQVQELIDKIKLEGVDVADKKAHEIELLAQQKADSIVSEAKAQSDEMIVTAKEEIKKMQESTQMALKQSSRDVILSLRKEIEGTLQGVVSNEIKDSLNADALSTILTEIIKDYLKGKKEESVEVVLSKANADKLKDGFIAKLQKQLKNPLTIKSSADVGAGFTISFDAGKSNYDFSDSSLAEYLSSFLNDRVSDLLKEAVK
ncbi:hypothetical protein MNBD_BACTEROID05-685 [hydrothermal vent metagenome]|uniref:V-type ATP synthase subunit E n=1 Tax=hydrothermal vent metagenome TaxID=652676 RepID=A0A3B0U4G7_9ZZZZ